MSVRVNLLPVEVEARQAARRQRLMAGVGVLGVVAALGGTWFWKTTQVDEARARLDDELATVRAMQAEVAELDEFAAIQASLRDADSHVATVLGGEIGVAGVLQDVAAVMPPGVELESMSMAVTPEATPGALAELVLNGRTVDRHAPGLERVLLELDKVAAFRAPYFGSAAVDNDEAVAFDVSVQLSAEVLTGRYVQGIPEELR